MPAAATAAAAAAATSALAATVIIANTIDQIFMNFYPVGESCPYWYPGICGSGFIYPRLNSTQLSQKPTNFNSTQLNLLRPRLGSARLNLLD